MGYFNPIPDKNFVIDVVVKWVVDVIAVIAIAILFIIYMCDTADMIGNSMSPVLSNSDSVLINKLSYEIGEPKRYDIIVYKNEDGDASIKRIIGLPGEEIKIKDSKIYIRKGKEEIILDDVYTKDKFEPGYVDEYVKIPMDEYFVMGDNRNLSEDSRFEYVGNIKRDSILGKAWMISSPFNRINFIK